MPQRAIDPLRCQIADGYSYLDVLAASVATTGLRSFPSDHSQWVNTPRDLRDDYPTCSRSCGSPSAAIASSSKSSSAG